MMAVPGSVSSAAAVMEEGGMAELMEQVEMVDFPEAAVDTAALPKVQLEGTWVVGVMVVVGLAGRAKAADARVGEGKCQEAWAWEVEDGTKVEAAFVKAVMADVEVMAPLATACMVVMMELAQVTAALIQVT